MLDNLEKYILDHKDEFDLYEPSPDVWDKIQKRKPKARLIQLKRKSYVWKIAAGILIFISAFGISELLHQNKENIAENKSNQIEIIIPEIQEAEVFYTSEVNRMMQEINLYTVDYPEIKKDINLEMNQLDSIYKELKNDLKDNADNEEVINAMIQNYKMKLEILQEILRQLQKSKNKKNDTKNEVTL